MITTIPADPHADILIPSHRNPDIVFQTIDFRLFAACPAWTEIVRVGSRSRNGLGSRWHRGGSQEILQFPACLVRAGKFENGAGF
jgi:hypothetical protein